ncbi:MAG: helix-turn-helix domain-containing protein [Pseudomonadota bacterium]
MKTLAYLDAAKQRLKIDSDYALSKILGVTTSAISNYRAERSRIDDDVALKLAEILEINPLEVIASANAERARTPEMRARWTGLMQKVSASFNYLMSRTTPRRRKQYATR